MPDGTELVDEIHEAKVRALQGGLERLDLALKDLPRAPRLAPHHAVWFEEALRAAIAKLRAALKD